MEKLEAIARQAACMRELGNCYCTGWPDRACYRGMVVIDAPPRGLGLATAAQVLGIISLVIWPLGGVAMLLGLWAANHGGRQSQAVLSRALTGIVCGALSSAVVAAAVVLLALHSGR